MALLKKDTPEETAVKAEQKRRQALDNAWKAYWESPAGRARAAYRAGDHVYQFSIEVMNQKAIIVAMVGSNTSNKTADPTALLNAVCREGWELVTADFPFVITGQQSRDKFMTSGQNVAVGGTVVGYYLFKRCEANLESGTDAELEQHLMASLSEPERPAASRNPESWNCDLCGQTFTAHEEAFLHSVNEHSVPVEDAKGTIRPQ